MPFARIARTCIVDVSLGIRFPVSYDGDGKQPQLSRDAGMGRNWRDIVKRRWLEALVVIAVVATLASLFWIPATTCTRPRLVDPTTADSQ
jgi:hypothetical protein